MARCECNQEDCILCEGMWFDHLAPEQVCRIRGLISRKTFEPADFLFFQGDPAEWLYVLRSGYVKRATSMPDGREQSLCLAMAGQVLGFSRPTDRFYSCTAQTLTPVTVCAIRVDDMYRVLEKNPAVSVRMVEMLSQELRRSQARICDLGLKSAAERVASLIASLAEHHVARSVPLILPLPLPLPLSRGEIAKMLGLTLSTVSRCMTWLQREGVILAPRAGVLDILDLDRLRELASDESRASASPYSSPERAAPQP
ncbi:MAG: Crp/Fnr family transcriptional regulator [Gammaproteobacteria bacterium]|nr:Crp/Fnr family transcriptional regulator [Gammaproteobacteria bacterium]NIT64332.1 Crp/Fnr family transcriptional regulator [Gammaproteobacteria bacterium]NIX10960.1 helix-turn-helix domain-containing protein [Gammaproteobacteria bacterium]NIY32912.1 helix-turn-helix domain-containing protein [Gammaproteobacteria bacterium]